MLSQRGDKYVKNIGKLSHYCDAPFVVGQALLISRERLQLIARKDFVLRI